MPWAYNGTPTLLRLPGGDGSRLALSFSGSFSGADSKPVNLGGLAALGQELILNPATYASPAVFGAVKGISLTVQFNVQTTTYVAAPLLFSFQDVLQVFSLSAPLTPNVYAGSGALPFPMRSIMARILSTSAPILQLVKYMDNNGVSPITFAAVWGTLFNFDVESVTVS